MATVFTKIITGEIPGRFVWRDEVCVGFLSINPLAHGHTLVVPINEVDHWIDLDADTNAHMMHVSHVIGQAQQSAFKPARIGLMIAGFEVPHTHLHVVPMNSMANLNFANVEANPDPADLDAAQASIIDTLRAAGEEPGV